MFHNFSLFSDLLMKPKHTAIIGALCGLLESDRNLTLNGCKHWFIKSIQNAKDSHSAWGKYLCPSRS